MADIKVLTLEGLQGYDEKIKSVITTGDSTTLNEAKKYADGLGANYDPAGTAQTKVNELANGAVKSNTQKITAVDTKVGNTASLGTEAKTDIVSAINEVLNAVEVGGTGSVVKLEEGTSPDYAKVYTLKQGDKSVGTINIPKDMVVSNGTVEVDPDGQEKGTYIVLTLANATSDKLYINVGKLVDIYIAKQGATQIQLAIDKGTREISATIVAGSITATELASNSVTTAKITDKNVTKEKLEDSIQASLGKADSAVQNVDSGTQNGTVAVDGVDVAVKGLASAAYTDASAYEVAGAVSKLEKGQVTTNKNDITALKSKVSTLESTKYVAITPEEIEAIFSGV